MSDNYYKNFGITKVSKDSIINHLLYNLYVPPTKDKGLNIPHIQPAEKHFVNQADILYMPQDGNYKYALVVVDIGSKLTDAEPLKDKTSSSVLNAFKKIYSRKILKIPKRLEIDSGSEFKGELKKYFEDNYVILRFGKPNRHRQQALVEKRNQQIATAL
jgi:hypothetical protein